MKVITFQVKLISCWIVFQSFDTVHTYSNCMENMRCNGSITTRWKMDLQNEYIRREALDPWLMTLT